MKTCIDLLRHGEPVGGVMFRGSTDHPLSEQGWQQMWASIDGKGGWHAVVTSPKIRSYAFARTIAEKYELPLEVLPDLREACYGDWEGLNAAQIKEIDPRGYAALYADPLHCRPPNAEPLVEFTQRVTQAFADVMHRYAGQHILMVSHAGTMRAILCDLLDAPMEAQQKISLPFAAFFSIQQDSEKGIQILW